jgi:hypothetical protein
MCCLWKLSRRSEFCSVAFCLSIERRNSGVHWYKYSFHCGTLHFTLKFCTHMCVCLCVRACIHVHVHVCVCENFVRNILFFLFIEWYAVHRQEFHDFMCVCIQFLYENIAVTWPRIACGIFLCPHSVSKDKSAACNVWRLARSTPLYLLALC